MIECKYVTCSYTSIYDLHDLAKAVESNNKVLVETINCLFKAVTLMSNHIDKLETEIERLKVNNCRAYETI